MLPLISFLIINHNIEKAKTDLIYQGFLEFPPKDFTLPKIENAVRQRRNQGDNSSVKERRAYGEKESDERETVPTKYTRGDMSETYAHIAKKQPAVASPSPFATGWSVS